jgi:hypothetical protein
MSTILNSNNIDAQDQFLAMNFIHCFKKWILNILSIWWCYV